MDEQADRTNYEQEHPSHPAEKEFFDRATQRIDKALRGIAETEERMARNTRRG
jgi:hypothetical protein